ncbi:conserved exported hypothetical protein [Pseudomonas sp. 8AS]|uniref:DUF6279 family lipoprotein n=1 Tax=Pseudomonas sp. 8AS TaxID=2653163 RepID=UPI0012F0C773|nr:DUF6279 family lipoprotein [Pseudomonas sp. 8AS]VXC32320.1 conserved exported hypothetical protein [Pseudomonas sp. 8AS]
MRLRRCAIALLCATLLLGACSRLDLAYRNLDWLIGWSLDDYLQLDGAQQAWLKPRLREHLDWHCSTQLPAYSAWLQRSAALVAQTPLHAQQFQAPFAEFRQAVDAITTQITPTGIELLRGLSPRQVAELDRALSEENEQLRREYLQPSLQEQIASRAERMGERLQPWFGELNRQQQERVAAWSRQLGEQNRLWLDNRVHWQGQFRALLDTRRSPDFAPRLQHLVQQRTASWTPAYREQFERSQVALAELLADLFNGADAGQRQRVQQRLAALRQDLDGLACTTPAEAAVANRSE